MGGSGGRLEAHRASARLTPLQRDARHAARRLERRHGHAGAQAARRIPGRAAGVRPSRRPVRRAPPGYPARPRAHRRPDPDPQRRRRLRSRARIPLERPAPRRSVLVPAGARHRHLRRLRHEPWSHRRRRRSALALRRAGPPQRRPLPQGQLPLSTVTDRVACNRTIDDWTAPPRIGGATATRPRLRMGPRPLFPRPPPVTPQGTSPELRARRGAAFPNHRRSTMATQTPPSMAATREKPAPEARETTREARIADPRMATPPARERRPAIMFSGGDIAIDGRFEGGEDIEINCRFRGEINVSGTVVITESGEFEGEIQARRAVVYGSFDGVLRAA